MREGKDTLTYKRTVQALYNHLKENSDPRFELRLIMYEVLGVMEFKLPKKPYQLKMAKALKIAQDLHDDQLKAELYSLYAEYSSSSDYLLYNLKALEIQGRVGHAYFPYVRNRYFSVSNALYRTEDYRQSIAYGKACLQLKTGDAKHWDPALYIFQMDLLGASYKKLGMDDSVTYYYQKIIDTLERNKHDNKLWVNLWFGIAKGNIGQVLVKQKKVKEGKTLIQEYLKSSIAYNDQLNISLSQNALAYVFYLQKNYHQALGSWRAAYHASLMAGSVENTIESLKGISDVYRQVGQTDSAFHYYNLCNSYSDSLTATINQSRLSAMNAKLAFDNMQKKLEMANITINNERSTRNLILVVLLLGAVILFLIYKRKRLSEQYLKAEIEYKRKTAEQEARKAKEEVFIFTKQIIEKNQLINTLREELASDAVNKSIDTKHAIENLSSYTLVTDSEWEKFRGEFSKAFPDFFLKLKSKAEQITPAEMRLAALIFLQLDNFQIANTLGISKDSVARSKRRLRQRLNLNQDASLEDYLNSIQSGINETSIALQTQTQSIIMD
ncbi:hypothetical protein [Solitalea longa]|nr:hypothetical protein [Solitalea longa]